MGPGDYLAAVGAAFGALGAIIAALLKYAVDKRDKEIDDDVAEAKKAATEKITKLEDEHKATAKKLEDEIRKLADENKHILLRHSDDAREFERKLHAAEIAHIKLEGEMKTITKTNEAIEKDLAEIARGMVPRKEWEERMDRFEDTISKLDSKLDNYARVSRWSPPSGMPAVRTPPLPREEDDMRTYKPPRERGDRDR